MQWSWANFWRAFFGAETVASIYGLVAAIVRDGPTMIGSFHISDHFLEVAYVFSTALGLLMLFALFFNLLMKLRWFSGIFSSKSNAFGALYNEIVDLRNSLLSLQLREDREEVYIEHLSRVYEFKTVLEELRIPYPAVVPDFANKEGVSALAKWVNFLIRLSAHARVRDIKKARRVLASLSHG